MKEYLLVDGYNIIYAWAELKKLANTNLESARQRLIHIMSDYQGYKQINVIVVFDAYNIKGQCKQYKQGQIDVIFTKEAETADNYIEKTTRDIGKNNFVRVATSDRIEQIVILGSGATRVSARELKIEVDLAKKSQRELFIEKRPSKNNMLADNLPEDIKKWMEDFIRK